ncbi:GerMN domain-containing protein [Christensenella tenuis]|uniref:GerMN domain-containing protein n=1 Tax=Christensenella tenuis TaxID=2763033 RepID=A0ABR7EBY4_9FIRM|nr:GerMN domain-containing protein [Christensenella tenuis]MBC5647272.1 GerMN domain-containing protein [Christensenella tenuis]
MKRILLFLLAAVLVFSGCSVVREDTNQQENYTETGAVMQPVSLEPSIVINPALYFLDKSKSELTLAAETRKLSVGQNERAEKKIIEAIIEGPATETYGPVAEGFSYEGIEILPNLINVFLGTDEEKTDEEIALMELSLVSTLVDFSGVSYINIFVNGIQTGYERQPVGVLQKPKGTLQEEITKIEQRARMEKPSMDVMLYFLDRTEQFLVPEARSFQFETNVPEEMIGAVVQAIIRGPENTYQHMPVVDKTIAELLGTEIVTLEDGQKIVRLNFNKAPVAITQQFSDGERIAALALAKTIIGFMPDINGIEIYVNGNAQAEPVIYTQSMSDELLGNDILLYFPNSTYTLFMSVERMVEQGTAGYPEEILAELMRGPAGLDDKDVSPAFLSGISMEDVNDVYLAGDVAVVDFNASISEKLEGISRKDESMMIYSIVNTLTNIENIKRVQFLLDGERVESLGGGIINIIDPLLKNPGIIKDE